MAYIERKIRSGRAIEIERFYRIRKKGGPQLSRSENMEKTSEEQMTINAAHAKKKLIRLVNCNFSPGDTFLTLTYSGDPPEKKQAAADLTNYIRRARRWYEKQGRKDFRYIAVTEMRGVRPHHHIIMPKMPADVVMDLWQCDQRGNRIPGRGRCPCDRLDDTGDYQFIARYLAKEDKPAGARRWKQSKNLKQPEIVYEREISQATMDRRHIPCPRGCTIIYEQHGARDGYAFAYLYAVKINR